MKKILIRLVFFVLMVGVFAGCDPNGNDPLHAELRLVPLTTGDLAKAIKGEDGYPYLPASELSAIMEKAALADIDFGDIKATKTLQYVLMNVGNTDVYDITLAANDLIIYPENIGLVPTPDEGGDLIALPIISITKEHVLPIDGVGSLIDIEIGSFNDVLFLSYNYNIVDTVNVDSFDITDEYTVYGNKQGALIKILVSGNEMSEASLNPVEYYDQSLAGTVLTASLYSSDLDTAVVQNNGNVPLRMRLVNPYLYYLGDGSTVMDTIICSGDEIDISGLLRGSGYFDDTFDPNKGNIIILGADRGQPYVFETMGELCIDGEFKIMVYEEEENY